MTRKCFTYSSVKKKKIDSYNNPQGIQQLIKSVDNFKIKSIQNKAAVLSKTKNKG